MDEEEDASETMVTSSQTVLSSPHVNKATHVKQEPVSSDEGEAEHFKRTAKIKASYGIRKFLQRENRTVVFDEDDERSPTRTQRKNTTDVRQQQGALSQYTAQLLSKAMDIMPTLIPVSASAEQSPGSFIEPLEQIPEPSLNLPDQPIVGITGYLGPYRTSTFYVEQGYSTLSTTENSIPPLSTMEVKQRAYVKFQRWLNRQQQGRFTSIQISMFFLFFIYVMWLFECQEVFSLLVHVFFL